MSKVAAKADIYVKFSFLRTREAAECLEHGLLFQKTQV